MLSRSKAEAAASWWGKPFPKAVAGPGWEKERGQETRSNGQCPAGGQRGPGGSPPAAAAL